MTLGNKNISLIVRQFGEYFGVNCVFLATSMKFSSMIEFDLVKKISLGATWKKIQYGHQFQDGHHYIRIFSWITVQLVFRLTAMSCDVFYVGRGTLPWRIDWLFKIQDGHNF